MNELKVLNEQEVDYTTELHSMPLITADHLGK